MRIDWIMRASETKNDIVKIIKLRESIAPAISLPRIMHRTAYIFVFITIAYILV